MKQKYPYIKGMKDIASAALKHTQEKCIKLYFQPQGVNSKLIS